MVLVEVRVKDDPLLSQQVARGEVERSFVSSLDGSAPLLALLGAETARGTGALSRCGGRAATAARRSCRLSPGRTSISDIAACASAVGCRSGSCAGAGGDQERGASGSRAGGASGSRASPTSLWKV